MIRNANSNDAENIAFIYNHYIDNTIITFEEDPVSAEDMKSRLAETVSSGLPWLVFEDGNSILGYAYASRWKGRCAYRFSVETTVYLSPSSTSKGIGTRLYKELLTRLKESSVHIAIGGVALPNPASVALHEKLGMEKVGEFKEVGFKFGAWVDVGYWQINLEVD